MSCAAINLDSAAEGTQINRQQNMRRSESQAVSGFNEVCL
jgi:hypothetical protein